MTNELIEIQNAENSTDSLMVELKARLDKIAEKQNKIDNTIAKIEGALN
jgi:prefoldin subunit 5